MNVSCSWKKKII